MKILTVLTFVFFATAMSASAEASAPQLKTSLRVQSLFQNDETCGQPSTFDIKRVRLGFAADLDDRLSGRAAIEGRDKDDGIIVMEAYGVYKIHKQLRFQAGQMYAPFGLESRRSFDKREFYDRSYATDAITRDLGRRPIDKRDARFRDIGAEAVGSFGIRGYRCTGDVMVMNGNGILTADNNNAKDVVGRVTVTAPFGLAVGGSYYYGTYVKAKDSTWLNERAFGAELSWNGRIGKLDSRFEAEYIQGKWDTTDAAIEPRGFYVAAAVYMTSYLQGAARYEWFEPDKNVDPSQDWRRISLALRCYLVRGSFVAVDYEIRDKDSVSIGNRLTVQMMTSL